MEDCVGEWRKGGGGGGRERKRKTFEEERARDWKKIFNDTFRSIFHKSHKINSVWKPAQRILIG